MNLGRRGIVVFAMLLAAASSPARAQSTAFTYQGELKHNGQPGNGIFDLQFALYANPAGGSPLGMTGCLNDVEVTDGRFTAIVDFGQQYATTAARYLEIAVRPDTGSGCATGAGFILLSRQLLTAAPVASHAHGAFRLDRPDGLLAVSVDPAGRVGVGTTTPGRGLTVAADMEMGTGHGDYRNFRIGGGNSSGFLYGSFPAYADGVHLGYNYYADSAGVHRIVQPSGATSRITTGYGFIALATGGVNAVPVNRVYIDASGNVSVQGNISTAPITRYKTIHGTALLPWVIPGSLPQEGWVRREPNGARATGQGSTFIAAIELPHLATITEFRLYAVDEQPSLNITATLGRTELANGNWAQMASITTAGASSFVQNLGTSAIVYSTVLNNTHAYWISAKMESSSTAHHRIVGMRITYTVTQPQP